MLLLVMGSQWLDSVMTQDAGITPTRPGAQSAMLEPLQHINYTKYTDVLNYKVQYGRNISVDYPKTQ